MQRLIPVLLVALILFCASTFSHTTAWADQDDGTLVAPPTPKGDPGIVTTTTGAGDDDQGGDPDTAGDTLGAKRLSDLLGGVDSCAGDQDAIWLDLMLQLMGYYTILR
ncbi:MAG: hypothetical protein R6X35_02870 [Candidatus Krumholzibacteriia bacterium]